MDDQQLYQEWIKANDAYNSDPNRYGNTHIKLMRISREMDRRNPKKQ
jgi:hypothetical protein